MLKGKGKRPPLTHPQRPIVLVDNNFTIRHHMLEMPLTSYATIPKVLERPKFKILTKPFIEFPFEISGHKLLVVELYWAISLN